MIVDDSVEERDEGWVEITRLEFLARLESVMTVDLVAFEIEHVGVMTPVGQVDSFTWIKTDEFDSQTPMFLCVKDTSQVKSNARWFIHEDLLDDTQ